MLRTLPEECLIQAPSGSAVMAAVAFDYRPTVYGEQPVESMRYSVEITARDTNFVRNCQIQGSMTKVLLVHPDISRLGGIENYFLKIKPHFGISYVSCGNSRRPGETGLPARLKRLAGDYYRFWKMVSQPDVSIVHLNPSLMPKMFYRDSVYLWLAACYKKKTVVFFHGWDSGFEKQIDRHRGRIFRLLYGRAGAFIVLASAFAEKLEAWGARQPVFKEVIVIEDEVVHGVHLDHLLQQRRLAPVKQLLFPARLMRTKGIYVVIQALATVQRRFKDTGLIIAGDGEDADRARQLVEELGLRNVEFTGIVSGDTKYDLFHRAHLLCFPTMHSEGFPNTIVEAMAFGLPVVTRPVGGIKDFFVNGENGYITESTNPEVFANLVETTLTDVDRCEQIARNNYCYAREHFLASDAARRLERIYESL